jgi:hypothetical protein
MSDKPSDLEQIAPALAILEDLHTATADDSFELLVPEGVLAGVTKAYGVVVRHIPGIDCVYVAKRAEVGRVRLL